MQNRNIKTIFMLATVFMLAITIVGCGSNKDAADTTKLALDENAIKDTYTGIDDVYVLKDTTDIDYLDWVLYDTSTVKDIKVDSSKVDTSKEGTYKITYKISVDCEALSKYTNHTYGKSKTETVTIEKKVTVVNKDKAQELADNNEIVCSGKGETVKKSDGSEITKEEVAPASTSTTGGSVVNSSNKEEVKPESTAKPTVNNDKDDNHSSDTSSHTHTWVDITETVNHPAVTHQEDVYENQRVCVKDAWDEQVVSSVVQECLQCGYRTSSPDEMTEHCFLEGHSCHNVKEYKTVHHDAVYETRKVKTGTKTVTDKAAWTETKVVGKKCSSCGAVEHY